MTSTYRPEQRKVPVALFTRSGWLRGTFHAPARLPLIDWLNNQQGFLNVTECQMRGQQLAFMALQRSSVLVVAPPPNEADTAQQAMHQRNTEARDCVALMDGITMRGLIDVVQGIRISDYLQKHRGFVALRNVTSWLGPQQDERQFPALLVNTDHVIGVSDQVR